MRILQQTPTWVALDKDAGDHVHPPEDSRFRVAKERILLYRLRDHLKTRVYPVHRLDAGTSGVLLFALNSEMASKLNEQFRLRQVRKTYHGIARGWLADDGQIDLPLESDSTGELVEALTHFRTLHRVELPHPVGKKYSTGRYSWLELRPQTGRFHQIRRHLNRVSHPLIGDAVHGDSHHNRFFRENLGVPGLCLRATILEFHCPSEGPQKIVAPENPKWERLSELFVSATKSGTVF